jgi:signal transduction histidine kinase
VARLAEKQEVSLDCHTPPDFGNIVSDEGKLRQVLYNFLAHAIGRSPAGASVRVEVAAADAGGLAIAIRDEGAPLEDPEHLFDPVDVDTPNECGTNMNELGLVIAHRLLGALGGTVSLSQPGGRGLEVRLSLPESPRERVELARPA